MANYPEFVTIKFAISRAGAIAVPFNFLYKQSELAYVLADSGCRVLVTMTGFGGLDYQSMLDRIAPGWDSADFADRRESDDDALPALRHVVLLETEEQARAGVHSVASLSALGSGHRVIGHGITADPTRPPTSSTPAGPRELRRA
jgi:fatty-acyl-CoA synthase